MPSPTASQLSRSTDNTSEAPLNSEPVLQVEPPLNEDPKVCSKIPVKNSARSSGTLSSHSDPLTQNGLNDGDGLYIVDKPSTPQSPLPLSLPATPLLQVRPSPGQGLTPSEIPLIQLITESAPFSDVNVRNYVVQAIKLGEILYPNVDNVNSPKLTDNV